MVHRLHPDPVLKESSNTAYMMPGLILCGNFMDFIEDGFKPVFAYGSSVTNIPLILLCGTCVNRKV